MSERIHFGALKLQDRDKIAATRQTVAPQASVLGESAQRNIAQREAVLQQIEQERLARSIAVPTNDIYVKLRLRELGRPICLFGEGPSERRNRLRSVMAKLGETNGMPRSILETELTGSEAQEEAFVTEGSQKLLQARQWIAKYSLAKAKERVSKQRELNIEIREKAEALSLKTITETELHQDPAIQRLAVIMEKEEKVKESIKKFVSTASEIGDVRVLSSCAIQPSKTPEYFLTGSWTGNCKLWKFASVSPELVYQGHSERVNDVVFHPFSGDSQSPSTVNLASSSADCTVKLWSLDSATALRTFEGHQLKVNRIAFHPSGRFLATTSFDCTWRLWDIEHDEELLLQEGHSKPVTTIAFQHDGSLVVSAGLDSFGRIWDTRTGRTVMVLKGHIKPIFATAFSPNGYQVATGSDDHSVRIWDLRVRRCLHTIPAHSKLISSIKYEPDYGNFLVTSSFDRTCKVWDAENFTPLRTLAGHEEKVMCVDVSRDKNNTILTASYDRTVKIWCEDL